jgi:hypothetical protein
LSRHHDRQEYVRQLAAAGAVIYRNNDIGVSDIQRSEYTTIYVEQYSADMLQYR